jgi:hypothetical protein
VACQGRELRDLHSSPASHSPQAALQLECGAGLRAAAGPGGTPSSGTALPPAGTGAGVGQGSLWWWCRPGGAGPLPLCRGPSMAGQGAGQARPGWAGLIRLIVTKRLSCHLPPANCNCQRNACNSTCSDMCLECPLASPGTVYHIPLVPAPAAATTPADGDNNHGDGIALNGVPLAHAGGWPCTARPWVQRQKLVTRPSRAQPGLVCAAVTCVDRSATRSPCPARAYPARACPMSANSNGRAPQYCAGGCTI